jgi:hypothetical protein
MAKTYRCPRCRGERTESRVYLRPDGRVFLCKDCEKERQAARRAREKDSR